MRRARSPLTALFLTVFVDLVGFGILIPLQPYLALEFGATKSGVTGLSWSYSAAQFLFAPFWGRLSDRLGRRPVLLVSIAGSVFTQLLFAGTQLFHHGLSPAVALGILYAARIGAGACGANVSTAQAYIADTTTPANRARGMGLIGAAFGLGFIVGPALGGLLDHFGHAVPLLCAASLSALNLLLAWVRLPESYPPEVRAAQPKTGARRANRVREIWGALFVPGLGALLLLQFTYIWSFSNMESTLALLLDERFRWNPASVGGLFAFTGLVMVVLQGGLVGRLTNVFGERALLLVGIPLTALGMLALPFVPTTASIYGAMACLAAGSGLTTPALSSLLSRRVAAQLQGTTLGLGASMSSLGRIFGPFWGGLSFDRWRYPAPYLSGAAVLIGSFIFAALAIPRLFTDAAPAIPTDADAAEAARTRSA